MKARKKNSVKEEKMKMGMIITIKKYSQSLKEAFMKMERKNENKESIKSEVNKNKNKKRF